MKRFSPLAASTAIAAQLAASILSLSACLNTESEDEHEEEHALYVIVRDSSGIAVTADTVHWSYAGDPVVSAKVAHSPLTDSVQRGAIRVGTTGSVWKITDHVHGSLYLRASRSGQDPVDALCMLSGYSVTKFSADTLSDTVSLTLKVTRICP
jgi:hypothetical protein